MRLNLLLCSVKFLHNVQAHHALCSASGGCSAAFIFFVCQAPGERHISNEHGFVWQSDIFPDGFSVLVKVLMQRSTQLTRK